MQESSRQLTFAAAIQEALQQSMQADPNVICFGLGATDPKHVFSTMDNLQELFGPQRVFDTPVSENAMTGMAIGAAIAGLRPVLTHQRFDFAFYSLDQIINNAAKWHYMFAGQRSVPITIRMIIGMGWGQGPTHSQNFQSLYAHIPGLKVVVPSNPYDAKGLLIQSIRDPNPVIFLEHRWLHNSQMEVPKEMYQVPLEGMNRHKEGKNLTVVTNSFLVLETLRAIRALEEFTDQTIELIDARILAPANFETLHASIQKTRRLLVVDPDHSYISFASEVMAYASEHFWGELLAPPMRIGLPNVPTPTSFSLTKDYYPTSLSLAENMASLLKLSITKEQLETKLMRSGPHDVPGSWFKGPF